jgi:hypothetical protein
MNTWDEADIFFSFFSRVSSVICISVCFMLVDFPSEQHKQRTFGKLETKKMGDAACVYIHTNTYILFQTFFTRHARYGLYANRDGYINSSIFTGSAGEQEIAAAATWFY